jgi:ACR3 family arsenite transporter
MFFSFLDLVQKRLFFFILFSIAGGLGFGYFSGGLPFSPFLCLLAALIMIYPSLVPLPFHRLRVGFSAYREIGISLFVNFVVSPALAYALGALFLADHPTLRVGLLLLSLLPGGGMATTWALRSRADMPASVGIILVNLFVSIFAVSLLLPVAMDRLVPASSVPVVDETVCVFEETTGGALSCGLGGADGLGMFSLALPMFVIVIVPLLLAYVTRMIIVRRNGVEYLESVKGRFGSASNLGLVVILFLLMALESNQALVEHPALLLRVAFPVLFFYAGLLSVSLIVAGRTRRTPRGKALVWGSFLRYITLALGLAVSLVYQDPVYALAILPVALAYFVQIPASFWLEKHFRGRFRGGY